MRTMNKIKFLRSKLKSFSDIYNGNSIPDDKKDSFVNKKIPYIATKNIDADTHQIDYENGLSVNEDDGFRIAKTKSSLLCIEGGSAGKKLGYLNQEVAFVNKLCCFTPKNIDSKFLFYSLQSSDFLSEFSLHLTGMIGGVKIGEIKNLYISHPDDLGEQHKIACFLDRKIGQIDNLISNQEKQIEKLKEYRQAIIDNAFVHCKKIKLKYVTSGISDGTHGTFVRVNDGKPLLSAKNLGDDQLIISSNESCISKEDYESIVKCGFPKKNDILMCCVGDIGKVLIYDRVEVHAFQRSVMFIRPSNKILPKFLLYGLRTSNVRAQETKTANKTIQSGLYQGLMKELFVPYVEGTPQQEEILSSIECTLKCIEKLSCIKQEKISVLKSCKQSLIFEYVTGKKRVSL